MRERRFDRGRPLIVATAEQLAIEIDGDANLRGGGNDRMRCRVRYALFESIQPAIVSQRLLRGEHSLGRAGFDVCTEMIVASVANQIPYRAVGEHHLNSGMAPGPGCRESGPHHNSE